MSQGLASIPKDLVFEKQLKKNLNIFKGDLKEGEQVGMAWGRRQTARKVSVFKDLMHQQFWGRWGHLGKLVSLIKSRFP